MSLTITSITAASLGFLMLPLAMLVTMQRIKLGNLVMGDGGDETLQRRIRAHGNFIEYVPLILILLALSELQKAPTWLLTTTAILLVVSRLLHASVALFTPNASAPRGISMLMTHASYLVPSIWLLSWTFVGAT